MMNFISTSYFYKSKFQKIRWFTSKFIYLIIVLAVLCECSQDPDPKKIIDGKKLEQGFQNPPDSAKPWVYWFWVNGNVTKQGITADLESLKKVGVGGVIWMGIGGYHFAPPGPVKPYSQEFYSNMQWALHEADSLGITVDITGDYGYGMGGGKITPDLSMQKLVTSQTVIDGGQKVDTVLKRPKVSKKNVKKVTIRPGKKLNAEVQKNLKKDSYQDIAVIATPYSPARQSYQMPKLGLRTGTGGGRETYFLHLKGLSSPSGVVIPKDSIIDLTDKMKSDGTLHWNAPPGKWVITRYGHGSNFRMTRPNPPAAIGLQVDRLRKKGLDVHFNHFLKPILKDAGDLDGKTLKYVHIDSWEAGTQNWTGKFPKEFRKINGYSILPWLPVLTGHIVGSPELTQRFLWDFRKTASEMLLDNYIRQFKKLASKYGVKFSNEPYGRLDVNDFKYANISDLPMAEFWTTGKGRFPRISNNYHHTMKEVSSAAHTHGKSRVGSESFTGERGWSTTPYKLKAMGDKAFSQGINLFVLHYSAEQAYKDAIPGITHRIWGQHFERFNTWWYYSKPWFNYLARSQYMLQQGRFVADVVYFFGEGSPLKVKGMKLNLPQGYDYDLCSSEILQQMGVRNGKVVLPSGMTYNYLLLPKTNRLTLASAKKIKELVKSGARVIAQKPIKGTPGLSGYPKANEKVKQIGNWLWKQDRVIKETANKINWDKIFHKGEIKPDLEGKGLNYIHRKAGNIDFYFVANPKPKVVKEKCTFRISGKIPELWNPETGEIRELSKYNISDGRTAVPLRFDPSQSWFVVFRKTASSKVSKGRNFPEHHLVKDINGPWEVSFDSSWGGPVQPVAFDTLQDWRNNKDTGIRYYSGTAIYKNSFNLSRSKLSDSTSVLLDLGKVYVMARVRVNGKVCGIAWKPPYQVDISNAIHSGKNSLEVDVVNLWINRMIGDEHLPKDAQWRKDIHGVKILKKWPKWFLKGKPRPSGRYTFSTAKYYSKNDTLVPSGLLGPVRIYKQKVE